MADEDIKPTILLAQIVSKTLYQISKLFCKVIKNTTFFTNLANSGKSIDGTGE
jgi:hypothetical protein